MRILDDEVGQSFLPCPVYTTLPTNPVEGLEGYYNGDKVVYLGGSWKKYAALSNLS
ncbi:hypothetical protein D3C71_2218380 [compost metagenome]